MLREWWNSRKARYQADALREAANAERHARAKELIAKPYKSLGELSELELYESTMRIAGLTDQTTMWRDRINLARSFDRGGLGGSGATNHTNRRGADFPFFANEQEHAIHRDASRLLVGTDPNAQGLMRGLTSYTIGKGSTVRVKPVTSQYEDTAKQAQAVIDQFTDAHRWASRQREFFRRTHRDGDGLMRIFPDGNGSATIRFVWPEQVRQPAGTDSVEWAFGVQTDPDDAETIKAYAVHALEQSALDHEIVPFNNIVHLKVNTDTGVRRGLPDFTFSTLDVLQDADKLCDNMGLGSAAQAAIAYIRQHTGMSASTARAFPNSGPQSNRNITRTDPLTGEEMRTAKVTQPCQVVDVNENTEFLASPYSAGVTGHLEVSKMLFRRACVRWNAPEWLGTADASNNNYASSLTAESPFVLGIEAMQEEYADCFRSMFRRVLSFAAAAGRLPKNVLDLVRIEVTFPSPVARDRMQETQRSQIQIQGGWKSPQKAAEEDGYDFVEVMRERKEAASMGWNDPNGQGQQQDSLAQTLGQSAWEALFEDIAGGGFTGTIKDKLGRERHYVNGKQVASSGDSQKSDRSKIPSDAPSHDAILDEIDKLVPDSASAQTRSKVRAIASKVYTVVFNKATELSLLAHNLAPDILDTAQDYEKIAYAKNNALGQVAHDPFAEHLGVPLTAVSAIISKVAGAAASWIAKRKGAKEAWEDTGTSEQIAESVVELWGSLFKELGVEAHVPSVADVVAWLNSRRESRERTQRRQAIREAISQGFTGTVKDKLGREYHYVNGKRTASGAGDQGPDHSHQAEKADEYARRAAKLRATGPEGHWPSRAFDYAASVFKSKPIPDDAPSDRAVKVAFSRYSDAETGSTPLRLVRNNPEKYGLNSDDHAFLAAASAKMHDDLGQIGQSAAHHMGKLLADKPDGGSPTTDAKQVAASYLITKDELDGPMGEALRTLASKSNSATLPSGAIVYQPTEATAKIVKAIGEDTSIGTNKVKDSIDDLWAATEGRETLVRGDTEYRQLHGDLWVSNDGTSTGKKIIARDRLPANLKQKSAADAT